MTRTDGIRACVTTSIHTGTPYTFFQSEFLPIELATEHWISLINGTSVSRCDGMTFSGVNTHAAQSFESDRRSTMKYVMPNSTESLGTNNHVHVFRLTRMTLSTLGYFPPRTGPWATQRKEVETNKLVSAVTEMLLDCGDSEDFAYDARQYSDLFGLDANVPFGFVPQNFVDSLASSLALTSCIGGGPAIQFSCVTEGQSPDAINTAAGVTTSSSTTITSAGCFHPGACPTKTNIMLEATPAAKPSAHTPLDTASNKEMSMTTIERSSASIMSRPQAVSRISEATTNTLPFSARSTDAPKESSWSSGNSPQSPDSTIAVSSQKQYGSVMQTPTSSGRISTSDIVNSNSLLIGAQLSSSEIPAENSVATPSGHYQPAVSLTEPSDSRQSAVPSLPATHPSISEAAITRAAASSSLGVPMALSGSTLANVGGSSPNNASPLSSTDIDGPSPATN